MKQSSSYKTTTRCPKTDFCSNLLSGAPFTPLPVCVSESFFPLFRQHQKKQTRSRKKGWKTIFPSRHGIDRDADKWPFTHINNRNGTVHVCEPDVIPWRWIVNAVTRRFSSSDDTNGSNCVPACLFQHCPSLTHTVIINCCCMYCVQWCGTFSFVVMF